WREVGDGVAAFLAPGLWRAYRLPLAFPDRGRGAGHFDLQPLGPLFTGGGPHFPLPVSAPDVRLFAGARQRFGEIELRAEGAPLHVMDLNTDASREGTLKFFERVNRHLAPVFERDELPLVLAGPGELLPLYRQANTFGRLIGRAYECNP